MSATVPVPIGDEMSDPVETSERRETVSGAASRGLPKEPVAGRAGSTPGQAMPRFGRPSRVVIGRASARERWGRRVIGAPRVGRDDGYQGVIVESRSK
jgi:hypothetical protein